MKIYAKQVPPEYQESPLFYGDWPEDVFVFGNRDFNDHSGRLEDIRRGLEELCNAWEDLTSGAPAYYNSWIDAIGECLPRDDGREYTRAERLRIREIAFDYTYTMNFTREKETLCAALELVTGRAWEYATIRGCCQGDWNYIIYPAEYRHEWVCEFECEYFNTGAEWIVDDDWSIYTHSWNSDGVREEIASAAGVDPVDVVLLEFTGWSKTPEYREA